MLFDVDDDAYADADALDKLDMMPVIILVSDVALSPGEPEETHTTNFVPAPCFLATCHGRGGYEWA